MLGLYKITHVRGKELPPANEVENNRKNLLWPPKDGLWFVYPLEEPDVYEYIYLCLTD